MYLLKTELSGRNLKFQWEIFRFKYREVSEQDIDVADPKRPMLENGEKSDTYWMCPFCKRKDFTELKDVWEHFDGSNRMSRDVRNPFLKSIFRSSVSWKSVRRKCATGERALRVNRSQVNIFPGTHWRSYRTNARRTGTWAETFSIVIFLIFWLGFAR